MKKEEGERKRVRERERERVAKRCVQLLVVGWQATRFKETIKNVLHCIVQEDLDTLSQKPTADVYRQARTSERALARRTLTNGRRGIAHAIPSLFPLSLSFLFLATGRGKNRAADVKFAVYVH